MSTTTSATWSGPFRHRGAEHSASGTDRGVARKYAARCSPPPVGAGSADHDVPVGKDVPEYQETAILGACTSAGEFGPPPFCLCRTCDLHVMGHQRLHPIGLESFHVLTRRPGTAKSLRRGHDQQGQDEKPDHRSPLCPGRVSPPKSLSVTETNAARRSSRGTNPQPLDLVGACERPHGPAVASGPCG